MFIRLQQFHCIFFVVDSTQNVISNLLLDLDIHQEIIFYAIFLIFSLSLIMIVLLAYLLHALLNLSCYLIYFSIEHCNHRNSLHDGSFFYSRSTSIHFTLIFGCFVKNSEADFIAALFNSSSFDISIHNTAALSLSLGQIQMVTDLDLTRIT